MPILGEKFDLIGRHTCTKYRLKLIIAAVYSLIICRMNKQKEVYSSTYKLSFVVTPQKAKLFSFFPKVTIL